MSNEQEIAENTVEVLFYHLERAPLEAVLPGLLEKTLQRGWKAVVQASSQERVDSIDMLLWTYNESSFLPHGSSRSGNQSEQPVFITTENENPNEANIRFFVDGADAGEIDGYTRVVFMFDGADQSAVAKAREQWKAIKSAGHTATYWRQNQQGRWEKQA